MSAQFIFSGGRRLYGTAGRHGFPCPRVVFTDWAKRCFGFALVALVALVGRFRRLAPRVFSEGERGGAAELDLCSILLARVRL